MRIRNIALLAIVGIALAQNVNAQNIKQTPLLPVGGPKFVGWTGLKVNTDSAALTLPSSAVFHYPVGPKGWYVVGFRNENDSTQDWRSYYGLQFDVRVPTRRTLQLQVTLATPPPALRQDYVAETHADIAVSGSGTGWQRVTLPWSAFDVDKSRLAMLKFVQQVKLSGKFTDGKTGTLELKQIRLTKAPVIALEAAVRGKAVQPGETAHYPIQVSNCADISQDVTLRFETYGWEAMPASVTPAQIKLAPGATTWVTVFVTVPSTGIPQGGHETQKLIALSAGTSTPTASVELITACDVTRPSILMTPQGWDAIRQKVKNYDWAQQQQAEYVKAAEDWTVPEAALPPNNYSVAEKHTYVFLNANFDTVPKAAIAWQLTHEKKYAEKVALFLRRLADEKTGYPSTFGGTNLGGPQEGGNFQSVAIAYDAILDSGTLSAADKRAIEHTFRLYMETFEEDLTVGNVGNWSTAQSTACLFCALALGDLVATDRYIHGPGGFTDFVSKGIMDDGWWWECSTGYNFWVASELTQAALACQPWGIDLIHLQLPASYSVNTITTPWALNPPYGISFDKWGPNYHNTRTIKNLWDAVPPVVDYRGITFGMNDGHEELVGGSRMELAYYVYRDPVYAALIKQAGKRDLIYGVPELPTDTPKTYLNSGYAENIGYALLRSQTPNRSPREQIQTVLKSGTQGGFHGHFDRASLDNLTRYGRSFWNPETIWWGYPNYMYKFFVQTSDAHNMVVVDQKMQEAVPSSQLLFHSGKMMQLAAMETNARWSDPPYGGMQYFHGDTFASQMRKNSQSIPLVTDRKYGDLGPYSDRVLQRRLAVVTDDYVVLADYLKGTQPHTFDNLFQTKEFSGLEADGKKFLRHDGQFNSDPHSSAQFITDCDWYQASAPAVGHFAFRYGPGADNAGTRFTYNEDGILKMDVRSLWPQSQEIMLGMPPETHDTQQWVTYSVTGDGKTLTKGESGVWILGAVDIDVPVTNLNELLLNVSTAGGKKKTLFWANARLVTSDGKEIPITGLGNGENIAIPSKIGSDYYGGPIKIAGLPYDAALPTQPIDTSKSAVIHISLAGKNAVRFKATLGGDYPLGDETQRRKVYSIRTQGTEARFLTVLEPYEDKPMVKSAQALSADKLRVELMDGRVQEITLTNLDGNGQNIGVTITETQGGKVLRTETSSQ